MDRLILDSRKFLVAVLVLLMIGAAWYFYDEPLLPETREWLESPPPVSPEDDVLQLLVRLANLDTPSLKQILPDTVCISFDRKCATYALSERENLKKHLPSDPEYWSVVEQTFNVNQISNDASRMKFYSGVDPNDPSRMVISESSTKALSATQNYMTALTLYYVRRLVEEGRIAPELAINSLNAQRRLLADAPFLTDKMIFVGTTSIALTALRLSMSATPPNNPDFSRLLEAARPLTKAERSLLTVFKSALRYSQPIESENISFTDRIISLRYTYRPNHALNFQMRNYKRLVHYSELMPNEFWQLDTWPAYDPATTWDKLINPIAVILSAVAESAYSNYVLSLQQLNMSTVLTRGWGDLLTKGEDNMSLSAKAAPYGWRWLWHDASLCLVAPDRAPWVNMVSNLCLPR